ncbi:uncharacterized protein LOC128647506 [Bombina bombina]|uniref:uncharacterized protein LOC128647506 n=1 Tax=Bombina bombina TaxID=8345 RepID=UPI00235B06F0|nr:uncharacterized protein LOC128647506 [Bombina bombina]
MEPPRKIAKTEDCEAKLLFRLGDEFVCTDGNCICPIIKAENSIRVLYKLQDKLFTNILYEVGKQTGIKARTIEFKSLSPACKLDGNIFVQCKSYQLINENKVSQYIKTFISTLRSRSKVKTILMDEVKDTKGIIPQPLLSEMDFEMYKLKLCYNELCEIDRDEEVKETFDFATENIKSCLQELREHHTKIAILSQNVRTVRVFVNAFGTYVFGNPTIKEMDEELSNLPDVVKDFIKRYPNKEQDFKLLMKPICHELEFACPENEVKSQETFLNLIKYFTENKRVDVEPYILAQKDIEGSYESTTKCIIHLRYGTVYQLAVEYFEVEELQTQLFELVTLQGNGSESDRGINNHIKNKSCECLKARFALLTDYNVSNTTEDLFQKFKTHEDIVLSEAVTKFAGKTEMYIGRGKQSTFDRIALQGILRGLTSGQASDNDESQDWKHRVAAVKEIVVYLPSKILYGGKEILEMPGTDDSDPLAMDFIQKALNTVDAIFVMSEFAFKIAEREVKDILINSEFMQAWKKNPDQYALMFLAYPEKDSKFQFGKDAQRKINRLEQQEKKKRDAELKEFKKLMNLVSLSTSMEKSILTSYVMPVLHTSIHMQEGPPHQVLSENADFLKYTGIQNLMVYLDTFISSKRRDTKAQSENLLSDLQKYINNSFTADEARAMLDFYKKNDVKNTREYTMYNKCDYLLISLNKQLQIMFKRTLKTEVDKLLRKLVEEAKQQWKISEDIIQSRGIFNPYYCGNNPSYELRLQKIIFSDNENHKRQIFELIKKEIKRLLIQYKNGVIRLFTEELNDVCINIRHNNIDSSAFIKQTIGNPMSEALQWYVGKYKMPFDKRTVDKCFEESKKRSLKKHILNLAYGMSDLDHSKQVVRQNIERTIMDVTVFFIENLMEIHEARWKSFVSHIKTKQGTPKMWHILFGKFKVISKKNQVKEKNSELSTVLKLGTARRKSASDWLGDCSQQRIDLQFIFHVFSSRRQKKMN